MNDTDKEQTVEREVEEITNQLAVYFGYAMSEHIGDATSLRFTRFAHWHLKKLSLLRSQHEEEVTKLKQQLDFVTGCENDLVDEQSIIIGSLEKQLSTSLEQNAVMRGALSSINDHLFWRVAPSSNGKHLFDDKEINNIKEIVENALQQTTSNGLVEKYEKALRLIDSHFCWRLSKGNKDGIHEVYNNDILLIQKYLVEALTPPTKTKDRE